MKSLLTKAVFNCVFLVLMQPLYAQLQFAKIFQDNMVLQRDAAIPLWGWANAGAELKVDFDNKNFSTTADTKGQWHLELPAMSAGGPHTLMIAAGSQEITLENIWIGDVWLCSGQSNMEWLVANSANATAEISAANDSLIRHFKVPLKGSSTPEKDLIGGTWEVCSPENVGEFSAVAYFFAKHIRQNQGVPIGLLNSSWGGSRIEPWMSAEALGFSNSKAAMAEMEGKVRRINEALLAKIVAEMGYVPYQDEGLRAGAKHWASPAYDDFVWGTMSLPGLWEQRGWEYLDGVVWFRKEIEVPEAIAQAEAILNLGKIDDSDIAWVNGQKVGSMTMAYNKDRKYYLPPGTLKAGKNTIAIRVEDTGGGGGVYGTSETLALESKNSKISLAGDWKYKIGEYRVAVEQNTNQVPTKLFNQMIHPILGLPIKGAIWYQGESNANGQDAIHYGDLFPKMIKDWRDRWEIGNFPFLFVQLANFQAAQPEPSESDWAVLRESQSETLKKSPNTGQAVIIDIGEAGDIHPKNKQDVGLRLALAARKLAYGEDLIYSGPVFKSMRKEGRKLRIQFDHIGSGLVTKGNASLKGFAIAGTDKKFVWATAKIEGNEVVVWSDEIPNPVAIRYAWADNPEGANLYNQEGLPASPFRKEQ